VEYVTDPNQPERRLTVDFEHCKCELTAQELRRYGSPHFDRRTVGQELARVIEKRATIMAHGVHLVDRDQIIVSNQAYPESAVVDPLADLELWEEWRLGIREFPYPGHYAPLGLFRQGIKTSSSSSVGVIGEIIAGLISEHLIARTILVRVIRRWPDFILYAGMQSEKNIFAFVESKAIGPDSDERRHVFRHRVPEPLFWDCALTAVHQLNADPLVEVWGAFTWVRNIVPFEIAVTFIQFVATNERRDLFASTDVPPAVLAGISERSVGAAVSELTDEERDKLTLERTRRPQDARIYQGRVLTRANQEFNSILSDELQGDDLHISDDARTKGLRAALNRLDREAQMYGRRFKEAKSASNDVKFVGSVGGRGVFMSGLSRQDFAKLRSAWKPTWTDAFEPWEVRDGTPFWRTGGALFSISGTDSAKPSV
jgi:hypothetical protein